MDFMAPFTAWLTANLHVVIIAITALIFVALIIFININLKLGRLNRRYRQIMTGAEGANLETVLMQHLDAVKEATAKVSALEQECRRLDSRLQNCTQKIGVVRFNAFEDTGSDLSFAIALLDARDNGVIISGIFGRNESRTYAKPVTAGQSSYFLTAEEKQALTAAKGNFSRS